MDDDTQLLQRYTREGAEEAFRQLVERQIRLVQATARRMVRDDHLAQEVTQTVFTDLARQANSLPPGVVLAGWLHRHTCFTATKALRTESRRRARERTAMEIHALNENAGSDEAWAKLAPVLDDALNDLADDDRDAVVLRYLQGRDLRAVGEALEASENAAQKRIGRALEKLREMLTRRGITLSSALLNTALDAGAAGAPVAAGIASNISTTALGQSATAPTTSNSPKEMPKSRIGMGAAAILAAGIIVVFVLMRSGSTGLPNAAEANSASNKKFTIAAPAITAPIAALAKIEATQVTPASVPPSGSAVAVISTGPTAANSPNIEPSNADPAMASPLGPPAAVGPASEMPGTYTGPSGPPTMITVTDGQLTKTTKNADGSITTEPYKEYGATVTITPGDQPNRYNLTFRSERDGKIVAIVNGIPDSHGYDPSIPLTPGR